MTQGKKKYTIKNNITMSKPIRFERQYMPKYKCTVVALNSKLSDFQGKPVMENGKLMVRLPEKTIKDCRKIDGCVYMHLGHVKESVMVGFIELYQKIVNSDKWRDNENGLMVPDDRLNLNL